VHEPADVRRELLCLGPRQQHAVVERSGYIIMQDFAPWKRSSGNWQQQKH
jgi:hypothetical protein